MQTHPAFGIALALCLVGGCERGPERVIDQAGLFGEAEKQRLTQFHDLLLADHAIDYRVMTVQSAPDINVLSHQSYAALDVGEMSPQGHGLLLVIDPGSRKVRLEVGYGLEGYFPDGFVAYVENRQMLPFFAADRVADGILATTEFIVDRAQRYRLGEASDDEVWLEGSGGGGATARMDNIERQPAGVNPGSTRPAGPSPEATLERYFEAMVQRDANPELAIYTPMTREMMRDWVMTPAQMDNLVATYRTCRPERSRLDSSGSLAVIRYDPAQRRCAPWFFQRAGNAWELDLTMMSRAIRFGRDNSWHFDPRAEHPYGFAFEDWQFDRNGFPLTGK